MVLGNRNSISIIIYSSLFLLTLESIILKVSPQLFPVFNSLPIIFIGQILKIEFFLSSLIISNFLFFILCLSDFFELEKNISLNFFYNYTIVSVLVFYFFALLKSSFEKKKII